MYNWVVAHAFRSLGHRVTVIASRLSRDIPACHEIDGIQVHRIFTRDRYRLRQLPVFGRYMRPMQQLAYSAAVNRLLRQVYVRDPFDIVEFADVNAEGYFYAQAPKSPFVIRCHTPTFVLARYYGNNEISYDTRITSACEKYTIRHAHALSAPSRDMAQTAADTCAIPVERFTVIPNALQIDEISEPISVSPNHSVTILHVGRLERAKGVVTLTHAIPQVLSQIPDTRFVFIGDDLPTTRGGSQRAELEHYLEKANALSHVKFVTNADHAMLMEYYRRADVCVVPSMLYESFSYTCAQAMAAGKPVVASRIGGIPETVDDGKSGILVLPGDVNALAEALVRLARDTSLREQMGRAGRAKASREFDAAEVAEQTLDLYADAATRFRRAMK